MTNATNPSKVTRLAQLLQIIAGIQKYFMAMSTIVLGGTSYTPAALITLLQSAVAAIRQTSNAKAAYLATVQAERDQLVEIGPVLRYIKTFVVTQFGNDQSSAQKLEDFGYAPRKARSKNVAVKAVAADKVRATRVARGTRGPKQKAKIKGTPAQPSSNGGAAAGTPAVKPS